MTAKISFRKTGSLLLTGFLLAGFIQPIFSQQNNFPAANWSTWFISDPGSIHIAPAPDAAQTRNEIRVIKQMVTTANDKKMQVIKYWDAGAPSHRWNQIAPTLISWTKFEHIARMPSAWMNAAIYDATILAWKEKLKYKRKRPHQVDASVNPLINAPDTYSYPCEHTVTAAAAAFVLGYFFPEKADSLIQLARQASQSRIDAGVQFPSDAEAGWKLGEEVARNIIEKAKQDGSDNKWDGTMNKDPKKWTGPYPLGITMTKFTPMVLRSVDQFRPAPPPDFEKDMQELKNHKKNFNSSYLAYYWANNGIDFWNDLASQKMFEYRMADDAPAAARLYAILHIAMHEAGISVMDAKYTYWGIRPAQYDTTYIPLIQTPPFPGYPSGHAMGTATSATVLSYFFPADEKEFHKLARDCADSRFFAGIHFRTDNETGTSMGNLLGEFVVKTLMNK